MENKPFKILSIDGGGIRGVFPAMFLSKLEEQLKEKGNPKTHIYEHFDLICGTSTGGILALALALGIPAQNIYKLYTDKASSIFGYKRNWLWRWLVSAHDNIGLEKLIQDEFKKANGGVDPRLDDCKTSICIPIYDLLQGKPSVLKTKHHQSFNRDFHIPAYMAAMATGAAPTYFQPYSGKYNDKSGNENAFSNKVDGGVMANNPALLGLIEAQTAFKIPTQNIRMLSIGTGHQKFSDADTRENWGIYYWMMKGGKKRLIDLFMQGQSQQVQNLISLLCYGIDSEKRDAPNFVYYRIDTELDDSLNIDMDEIDEDKLKRLAEKASHEFHTKASQIIPTFCQ
jgi:patatin-like phospholipase/acyl hydrolase